MPKGVYARRVAQPIDRFWRHVEPEPNSGCWLWTGAWHNGYGIFAVEGTKTVRAHRLAYEMSRGPIPLGLEPDHLCRVRCCVNPWHLQLVTRRENFLRGQHATAINYRLNVCPRGHSKADAYWDKRGWRICRRCAIDKSLDRRRRKGMALA